MLRRFNVDRAAQALITTPILMPPTQVFIPCRYIHRLLTPYMPRPETVGTPPHAVSGAREANRPRQMRP